MFIKINGKLFFFKDRKCTLYEHENLLINDGDQVVNGYYFGKLKKELGTFSVNFDGDVLSGKGAELSLLSLKTFTRTLTCNFPSLTVKASDKMIGEQFLVRIRIFPKSKIKIKSLDWIFSKKTSFEEVKKEFKSDILIVSPSYPSEQNKYFCGFVHSRLKEYKKNNIHFDLAVIHVYDETSIYNYEGITVVKGGFDLLTEILQNRSYKKILVHFFDEKYAKVLDREDLSSTQLYLWVHGPETLYWDWNYFVTPYFSQAEPLDEKMKVLFSEKNKIIKKYNLKQNVHWIFVSEWIKQRSEQLINIDFNNYTIIPNFVDSAVFKYRKKTKDLRKSIFMLRSFDNINKYSVDIAVRAIIYLSRKPVFKELTFNIYGTGSYYNELLSPLKDFSNVNLFPYFLSHSEISEAHEKNGIALFPSRYDAQGVSMCEAASSGLVVVGTNLKAIEEFIPKEFGTLSSMEDYKRVGEVINRLYDDQGLFDIASEKMHEKVTSSCGYDSTLKKEIDLISSEDHQPVNFQIKDNSSIDSEILLTIIVPSYNVGKFLNGTISSMITKGTNQSIEIIIVNDGSKDNTEEVAKKIIARYSNSKHSIRLISKENGGHGSTINVGIQQARGKFFKIVDGDDTLDTGSFEELLKFLENCESDCVLCDYYIDRIDTPTYEPVELYKNLTPYETYELDDLCMPKYGFNQYGPILATGTFKTSKLKDKFKISEKMYYVDMEFNAYIISFVDSITYLPLIIYKYRQGYSGQSISMESYKRNYKQHESVIFKLLDIVKKTNIQDCRKNLIIRTLIKPMINIQYFIIFEALKQPQIFKEFDQRLKQESVGFLEFLYSDNNSKRIEWCRKSNGFAIFLLILKNKMKENYESFKSTLRFALRRIAFFK